MKASRKHRRSLWLLPLLAVPLWLAWSLDGRQEPNEAAAKGHVQESEAPRTADELTQLATSAPVVERVAVARSVPQEPAPRARVTNEPWSLRGHVLDPLGNRVPDALVGLISLDGERPGERGEREVARADEAGEFTLKVPAGAVPSALTYIYSVAAPDYHVYDLLAARLAISVHGPEGVVTGARVFVMSHGRGHEIRSAEEPALIEVPPLESVFLTVRHPSSRVIDLDVEAPAAGLTREVTVSLETVVRPSMTVRLRGATAAGVERIRLYLETKRGFSHQELEVQQGSEPDTFEVPWIPFDPGRCILYLEPHDRGRVGAYITPRIEPIELPAIGKVFVELKLELRGRCTVSITAGHEEFWSASYRIRDDRGDVLLERDVIHFAPRNEFGEQEEIIFEDFEADPAPSFRTFKGNWVEDDRSIARRCGVLPTGSYTLEVESEGYATWSQPISILAGETTEVHIQLAPE